MTRISINGNNSASLGIDTNVDVNNGTRLKIFTTGTIGSGVFLSGQNDANGWLNHHAAPNFPLPLVPPFSLIGRIQVGEDFGVWFYVGKNFDKVIQGIVGTGRLFLKINDENPTDNTGLFDVDIDFENEVIVSEDFEREILAKHSIETGITVNLGDKLIFQAEGFIWTGVWFTGENGPEGWPNYNSSPLDFPLPSAPIYSLLGRVGSGTPFYIGRSLEKTFNSGVTGQLHLLINDKNLNDNTGGFKVKIQKIRSAPPVLVPFNIRATITIDEPTGVNVYEALSQGVMGFYEGGRKMRITRIDTTSVVANLGTIEVSAQPSPINSDVLVGGVINNLSLQINTKLGPVTATMSLSSFTTGARGPIGILPVINGQNLDYTSKKLTLVDVGVSMGSIFLVNGRNCSIKLEFDFLNDIPRL